MATLNRARSLIVGGAALAVAVTAVAMVATPSSQGQTITVYKTATCGCCSKWVEHLREAGFTVVAEDVTNLAQIKAEHGVTSNLASCHTAIADGYVVEGHVPADVIGKLLDERPSVIGITVPGMPMGSPGMEMGDRHDPYDVLTFDADGNTEIYASR
jgi:hypothetical protein